MAIHQVVIKDSNGNVKQVISQADAQAIFWERQTAGFDNSLKEQRPVKKIKVSCKLCEKIFIRQAHESYCRNPCTQYTVKQREKLKRVKKTFDPAGVCKICGKDFIKYKSFQIYCNDPCDGELAKREIAKKIKISKTKFLNCKLCGKEFKSVRPGCKNEKIYCSPYHKKTERRNARKKQEV